MIAHTNTNAINNYGIFPPYRLMPLSPNYHYIKCQDIWGISGGCVAGAVLLMGYCRNSIPDCCFLTESHGREMACYPGPIEARFDCYVWSNHSHQ